ncbi:hypothetical protein AOLI_G00294580 [Acnodon oligacanthus]
MTLARRRLKKHNLLASKHAAKDTKRWRDEKNIEKKSQMVREMKKYCVEAKRSKRSQGVNRQESGVGRFRPLRPVLALTPHFLPHMQVPRDGSCSALHSHYFVPWKQPKDKRGRSSQSVSRSVEAGLQQSTSIEWLQGGVSVEPGPRPTFRLGYCVATSRPIQRACVWLNCTNEHSQLSRAASQGPYSAAQCVGQVPAANTGRGHRGGQSGAVRATRPLVTRASPQLSQHTL